LIQSLSNKDYPKELWEQFGMCVFDECHHLSAEVFSNVMINIVTPYNLGLSGTMTRKDGLTKVFKYFIGPVIHKEKTDLTTEVFVKAIRIQNEDTFENVKTDFKGQPLYSCMISKLDYSDRNLTIANVVKNELKENENQQIMILAHTKSIVQDLFKHISTFEKSIGYYLGGMKEEHLKESESKKIILATYAMASEGLDIKKDCFMKLNSSMRALESMECIGLKPATKWSMRVFATCSESGNASHRSESSKSASKSSECTFTERGSILVS